MNCALDWPDATTTLGGMVTVPFPLPRLTVIALVAAPVRVTVHCAVPGAFTVPGVQLSALNCSVAAVTVTVAVLLCAPLVTVSVTICVVATAPAVTPKVAVLDPAANGTVAGAVSAALLLDTSIAIAATAGLFRLTVQVDTAPAPTVFGAQLNALNCIGALKLSVKVCEAPFKLAVSTAV